MAISGAIIGPSGCGKSTLLKVITGIAHGDEEGEIHWEGRNLTQHDFSPPRSVMCRSSASRMTD